MESVYSADPALSVEPDHYADGVPVFKPTMDQFKDFYKYNKAINKYGMELGIVKIVPPAEWLRLLDGTYVEDNLKNIRIKNPIVQNINPTGGFKGVYSSQNVEKQRSYDIFLWKELSKKSNFVPPTSRKSRRRLPDDDETEDEHEELPNAEVTKSLLEGEFNIDASEFTSHRCKELEHMYWKSLGYAEPMYGADMLGSLFLDEKTPWNVAHLPNILDLMEESIPGVNDAYLYAGLWKATFSWHLEDQDLYSINYLHFGAPKQWYSISQKDSGKFYDLMKEIFDDEYKHCPEFLRHKLFMASPQFLAKNGIKCNSVVHNQGEFMITYPYGYHSGFNYGYNLAESVNFALDDWFPFAEKTHKCECIADSVGINYKQIYCKFKGIPYLDDIKEQKEEKEQKSLPEKEKRGRPRKPRAKGPKECALCPNTLNDEAKTLAPFQLLSSDLLDPKTSSNQNVHRICAEMFPKQLEISGSAVRGMNEISKAQRNLKCGVCHSAGVSVGACFQCSYGKCAKAYHGTCGLLGGVQFDSSLCKTHRPSAGPFYDHESPELHQLVENFQKGSIVQFTLARLPSKRHTGEVFCGIVQKNNPQEGSLELLAYPELKETIEVRYGDVMLNKNGDYPTPVAKSGKRSASTDSVPRKLPHYTPMSPGSCQARSPNPNNFPVHQLPRFVERF